MRVARTWGWHVSVASFGCALALAWFAPSAMAIAANGSFIQVTGNPAIYRVVGGAAIHLDSCAPLGGCPGLQQIPSLAGYAAVPANGSFMRMADGPIPGWIGVAIGGAFVHVDSCAPLGGCPGTVNIDSGGANDYLRAHPLPPDGSFMRMADGPVAGWIGEVIGQALIHVDSCAPLGGCPGTVNFDSGGVGDYRNAHPLPLNGTYVRVADGAQAGLISRAAGGALLTISDCVPLGGCGGPRTLDSGGFSDWVRAHPVPADGTLLLALPSNSTWEVLGGQRQVAPASPAAVAVDDSSLAPIPIAPAPGSGQRTVAVRAPVARRVHVSLRLSWRWNRRVTELLAVKARGLRRPMRVTVTCRGRGCPWRRVGDGRAARVLRRLRGRLFRAGDRIVITIRARGAEPERIKVRIRAGRIPLVRLLDP